MDLKKALIPAILVAFAITIIYFLAQPIPYLVGAFVVDDGMYYLEVPRNIVMGNGVTYDNRTTTNGFHPLWGGIGVVMALVSGTGSDALFRTALIVQALFVLLSLLCLWRITKDAGMEPLGALLAMAALFFARLDLWLSTMESATLLLALLLLITVSLRLDLLRSRRVTHNVLLGVLFAVVFLARLDTIFIVIAFLVMQSREHIGKGFRVANLVPPAISGVVFTLLAAPYLIANQLFFGSIVPVSGMKKMSESSALFENVSALSSSVLKAISAKLHSPVAMVVVAGIAVVALFVWVCTRSTASAGLREAARGGVLPALALGTVMRGLYLLDHVEEYTKVPWYWVPEYVVACLAIGVLVTAVMRLPAGRWLRTTAAAYVIAAITFVAGGRYLVSDAARYQESNRIVYDCARWSSTNVQEGALFAMNDSGVFAFFSNHDVIPLNGLITDRPTMERLHRGEHRKVMEHFDVDYLVHYVRENATVPEHVVMYQSSAIPDGRYSSQRLMVMRFAEYPEETIEFGFKLPRDR